MSSAEAAAGCPVAITGVGLITAARCGLVGALGAMQRGHSFVSQHDDGVWPRSRVDMTHVPWPAGPLWRSLHRYAGDGAQMAVAAARQALAQAGLDAAAADVRGATLVACETDRCDWEAYTRVTVDDDDPRPLAWRLYDELDPAFTRRASSMQTVRLLARLTGFSGPAAVVGRPWSGGLCALSQALVLMESGEMDRVLLAATTPTMYAMAELAENHRGPLAPDVQEGRGPFDRDRRGRYLGEGAVALVLETSGAAQDRGAAVLGHVLACETRCGPSPSSALGMAIDSVVAAAGRRPQVVWAHGSGSREGDREEARTLAAQVDAPVTASKGCFGDMGAASALADIALALGAMSCGWLPPVSLLRQVDPALGGIDIVRGAPRDLPAAEVALITVCEQPAGAALVRLVDREQCLEVVESSVQSCG